MTEVKLSHWVADQLVAHGIRDAFMLTGGGRDAPQPFDRHPP
jgi:hypothetical protein